MNIHYALNCGLILALLVGCSSQSTNTETTLKKSFGTRQLEQMLDDRPDMKGILPSVHPIVTWLIDGFDGKRLGQRVYWNANSPQSGRSAQHGPSYATYSPYISISGGTEITAIDKWAAVVFEMHNLENTDEFESLTTQAMEGKLDADDYASKCVELEFAAVERTRKFFQDNPLPASSHGRDELYKWVSSGTQTFEEYKAAFDVPGMNALSSNFEYFKDYYESSIVPYASVMRQTKQ